MVAAVRRGQSLHQVAHLFGVSPATVLRWVRRACGQRLDRIDWSDRSTAPRQTRRTPAAVEARVLEARQALRHHSDLGFYGAEAIQAELARQGVADIPSLRTIHRILERGGVLDGQRRQRRPPPPPGWYLPDVRARRVELDSFDIVEGLTIKGGPAVEVLTGTPLHGGLVATWPRGGVVTAAFVINCLVEHWREFGLPAYAQFDNDPIFQGAHTHPDIVGRVSRCCLGLKVVPVFVTPGEMGFQAAIEAYNGSWQSRVWARFHHADLAALTACSGRHVAALRRHRAARRESAPRRRPFPKGWHLDLQAPLRGKMVYLRRTSAAGAVEVLGRTFAVDARWPQRLVRVEVDLSGGWLRAYRLRRREPEQQPLLATIRHRLPQRAFHE